VPRGAILGEQGGVPVDETDPRLSVNQENGTKVADIRDGLSDGSLGSRTSGEKGKVQTGNKPSTHS
jgi:hypothetical protein